MKLWMSRCAQGVQGLLRVRRSSDDATEAVASRSGEATATTGGRWLCSISTATKKLLIRVHLFVNDGILGGESLLGI